MLKNIRLNKEICEFIGLFIGDGYLGNYIEIYGHYQLEKFLKEIGLSNKRHLSKIKMPL
jgi:hypothetical protein